MKTKLNIHNISIKCGKCNRDMLKAVINNKQLFECINDGCSKYGQTYEYQPIEIELKEVK